MNDEVGGARSASAEDIRNLLEWASAAARSNLTPQLMRRAALVLADDISAMVAGSREPEVRRIHSAAAPGCEQATIFSNVVRGRVSSREAAIGNGMAVTWCEVDEGFRSVPCHAGASILPCLLAESERLRLSTSEVLIRLLVAYETLVRIALAFRFSTMLSHPHGVWAGLGSALGAGLARNHDGEQLLGGASSAVTMAFAAPFSHAVEGALVRNAWTAAGAQIGLMCADWAEVGVTGIAESFYDSLTVSLQALPEPLNIANLGSEWMALDGYHKQFACCQYAHSAISATLALRQTMPGDFNACDAIERIVVETHPLGETLNNPEPCSSLAAKFSMFHAVAAATVLGNAEPQSFGMEAVRRSDLAEMRHRVSILPHPSVGAWPEDRPARVTWEMRDGRRLVEECRSAPGGADQPLSEEGLLFKFRNLTEAEFPSMAAQLERLVALDECSLQMPWTQCVDHMIGR